MARQGKNILMKDLTVTPIDDLVRSSKGVLVELPPFAEGVPFVAHLKRPSMLALVRSGKIPNSLLGAANKLFAEGIDSQDSLGEVFDVLDTLCESCFVEPTYKELKDNGIELTDDQLMFVFNYTQRGVAALHGFRSQLKSDGDSENEQPVPQASK